MGFSQTYQAVVLRATDTGEADRFCIFLTRERGKIAARAKSARTLESRLRGSLLPGTRLLVSLHEGTSACTITGCSDAVMPPPWMSDLRALTTFEQCVELLLMLVEDGEPMPGVFDLLVAILSTPTPLDHMFEVFALRFFAISGTLPLVEEDVRFAALSKDDRRDLIALSNGPTASLSESLTLSPTIQRFIHTFITQELPRTMRSLEGKPS